MRYSKIFIPTMKNNPSDSKVISHSLMVKSGMIRKLASGIYTYLPIGLIIIKKISNIIRLELKNIDIQELQMPIMQPAKIWKISKRWDKYGNELFKFRDRRKTDFCIAPTHEEIITDIISNNLNSYKQLPLIFYQIQTKFRDEIRPKSGLIRCREFLMKDAYSFSLNEYCSRSIYEKMKDIYINIFNKCGLNFTMVEANNGNIGGNISHEFQAFSNIGDDNIVICKDCNYSSNIELTKIFNDNINAELNDELSELTEEIDTPNKKNINELSSFLKVKKDNFIKSLMFVIDNEFIMVLCRGNHEVSEVKLKIHFNANNVKLMSDEEVIKFVGPIGYIGPIGINKDIKIISDFALKNSINLIAGSLKKNKHLKNISVNRDFKTDFFDLRKVSIGDLCGKCGGILEIKNSIEVGHIFNLGTSYSKCLNATVLDQKGKKCFLNMGCYGIGIGRIMSSVIEQNNDKDGIIWPLNISPFQVVIVCLLNEESILNISEKIYKELLDLNIDVLLDDRNERAGVKLKDSDLLGCSIRVSIGKYFLIDKKIEIIFRKNKTKIIKLPVNKVSLFIYDAIKNSFK